MEDKYLHSPILRNALILDIDKYVDYYLDSLAWLEGYYEGNPSQEVGEYSTVALRTIDA